MFGHTFVKLGKYNALGLKYNDACMIHFVQVSWIYREVGIVLDPHIYVADAGSKPIRD